MEILVTNDGSARALDILPAARDLAEATGASIALVRILNPSIDCGGEIALTLAEAVETTRAKWLAALEAALDATGTTATPLVIVREAREEPWQSILRVARDRRSSLIAMATRGSGVLRRVLVGSVAMAVMSNAETPVMVSGPRMQPPAPAEHYRLVATTDGSPASATVVRALAPLAESSRVDVTLLRICWPGDADEEAHEQVRSLALELPHAERVTTAVREIALVDGASQGITEVARELGASAIAMATHGHRGAYHVFAGSIALGVVARAEVPVILAKSARDA